MTNEEFAAEMMKELAARNADMPFEAVLNIVTHTSSAGPPNITPSKLVDVWIQMHLTASLTTDEWDSVRDPSPMLSRIRFRDFKRELTKFGCACCWRVQDLLPDEVFQKLIEATERHLGDLVSVEELEAAQELAGLAQRRFVGYDEVRQTAKLLDHRDAGMWRSVHAMDAVFSLDEMGYHAAANASLNAATARAGSDAGEGYDAERGAQANLLRELLGNPLRVAERTGDAKD